MLLVFMESLLEKRGAPQLPLPLVSIPSSRAAVWDGWRGGTIRIEPRVVGKPRSSHDAFKTHLSIHPCPSISEPKAGLNQDTSLSSGPPTGGHQVLPPVDNVYIRTYIPTFDLSRTRKDSELAPALLAVRSITVAC